MERSSQETTQSPEAYTSRDPLFGEIRGMLDQLRLYEKAYAVFETVILGPKEYWPQKTVSIGGNTSNVTDKEALLTTHLDERLLDFRRQYVIGMLKRADDHFSIHDNELSATARDALDEEAIRETTKKCIHDWGRQHHVTGQNTVLVRNESNNFMVEYVTKTNQAARQLHDSSSPKNNPDFHFSSPQDPEYDQERDLTIGHELPRLASKLFTQSMRERLNQITGALQAPNQRGAVLNTSNFVSRTGRLALGYAKNWWREGRNTDPKTGEKSIAKPQVPLRVENHHKTTDMYLRRAAYDLSDFVKSIANPKTTPVFEKVLASASTKYRHDTVAGLPMIIQDLRSKLSTAQFETAMKKFLDEEVEPLLK